MPTLAQGHTWVSTEPGLEAECPGFCRHELIPQKKSLGAQAALPPLPGWVESRAGRAASKPN